MSISVEELLNFLKLDEYLLNFSNNKVTDLRDIDESVLIKIGIDKIGHRKRILTELATLLGVGSYSPQHDSKNNSFESNLYHRIGTEDDNNGEEGPPLPPKLKTHHNGGKQVDNSNVKVTPPKQKPVKPPRLTAPTKRTTPQGENNSSQTHSEPNSPKSPPLSNTTSTIVKQETLQTFKPNDSPVNPSLFFPPPPSYSPPPTPSEQLSEQPSEQPTTPSLSESIAKALNDESLMLQGDSPTKMEVEKKVKPAPAIPPRDYPADRLVRRTLTKEDRMQKSMSVDLLALDELVKDLTVYDYATGNLPRSTSLKKSNTICASNKSLDVALKKARLNKSEKTRSRVSSFDPRKSFGGNSSRNKNKSLDESMSFSDDDVSDDEDYTKENEDLDGTPVSMKRDKDELYSIVGHGKNAESKPMHRKSRFFQPKSGNLLMRVGRKCVSRWVEFTGSEIKCYKERNGILKLTVPVLSMTDVIWEKDAKKPTFHITTRNKKYTFTEPNGDHDAMTIWAKVILEGALARSDEVDDNQPAGLMANPDMEGYLLKEGHNILHEFKKRYVVLKDTKLCYYNTKEEFDEDKDFLSCLEMALVSLKCEEDKLKLLLHTHTNKSYVFQADDLALFNSWKEAIDNSIQMSHGNDKILNQIQENTSNMKCADCGDDNPIYASVNLCVVTCPKCIGIHRNMGAHISKTKSLLMDERVWTPSSVKLLQTIGNERANSLWSHNLPTDDMIGPTSNEEEREEFIKDKYKEKKYFEWSPLFGQPDALGARLREVVVTDDPLETLKLIVSGADIYYVGEGSEDQRTPFELAKESEMDLQVELLCQFNGHLTKEERKALEQQKPAMQHQPKSGVLQIKTTRSDTLKERQCTLLDKKLELKKGDKIDDVETIDLTRLEEIEIDKEDKLTLILKMPERTYFLRPFLPEETESWFRAIHNKQVFGVSIEVQECNKKQIPYLVGECISYMEQHALMTEGIYRLSGSQSLIKRLTLLFNQDAANMKLQFDDYPDIHAVAGLIKLYLRQLPDPLLTGKLYNDWIANAEETLNEEDHNKKLYTYKALLDGLPPSNYTTLRFLILHLNQVINLSEINKMAINNITVIFGPIMLNSGNSVDQAWLKREYSVVRDLLLYYQWLFDVTEVEVKVLKGMIAFLRAPQSQQQLTVADSTMVTIFVGDDEDQMKMNSNTKQMEVCLFCLKKYNLSVNSDWGLFEVTVDGGLDRLVHPSEGVLKLAENMGVKRKLVVKNNYVTDIVNSHKSSNLCVTGHLNYNKSGTSWKKNFYIELKTGNLKVYKAKGNTKEEENISIHEIQLFIGCNPKKKCPTRFGFALFKPREEEFRYFCAEDENELNKFIANILQVKYPLGVWTPISSPKDEPAISDSTDDSLFWGRQSTIIRPSGTANRFRSQLEGRRTTLKNIKNIFINKGQ